MADDRVEIEIVLDDGSIQKGFAKFEQTAKKTGTKAGKSLQKGLGDNASQGLKVLGTRLLAVGAAFAAAFGTKRTIAAANEQEDAINRLNTSMRLTGNFTNAASADFQKFASSLQEQTRFGDEVILKNAALLQSLGSLSNAALKPATQAALDLAAGLGIDLRSATVLVGKAASGEVSSFSRYGLAISKGKDNAETFKNTLTALNKQFGGAAAAQVNTFSGASEQLSNNFGDLLEEVGFLTTKSPILIELFKIAGEIIKDVGNRIKGFREGRDEMDSLVITTLDLAIALAPVANGFQGIFNVANLVFNGLRLGLQGAVLGVATFAESVIGLATKIPGVGDKFKGVLEGVSDFKESAGDVFDQFVVETNDALDGIDTFTAEDKFRMLSENIRNRVVEAAQSSNDLKDQAAKSTEGISADLELFGGIFEETVVFKTEEGVKKAKKQLADFEKASKKAFLQGFGQAVGQGFAAFGKALVEGDNALKAFAAAFISSIGQMAIQQGTSFILQGIGYQFVPGFQGLGVSLIAAGAAMATFGGALSAISGGGGGASAGAGAGGGGGGGIDVGDVATEPGEIIPPEEAGTAVTVNVEGSIFADDTVGDRIADLVTDSFDQRGVKIFAG